MDNILKKTIEYPLKRKEERVIDLCREDFIKNVETIINASYNLAYIGLRRGNLSFYFSGMSLPKHLFFGVLDLEKLNKYKNIKYCGERFIESGETKGFKETVLSLRDYTKFLKDTLFEIHLQKNQN